MDSKKLALACRELADNKKAENLVVLDVRKISTVTDYFVIATGTSEPHLRAIENEILRGLQDDHGLKPNQSEGTAQSNWVVVDFFDVIVHIMRPEVRERYDLEGLWTDAAQVKPPAPRKKAEPKAPDVAETPKATKIPKAVKTKTKTKAVASEQ
jgi:ribosome-associated protein